MPSPRPARAGCRAGPVTGLPVLAVLAGMAAGPGPGRVAGRGAAAGAGWAGPRRCGGGFWPAPYLRRAWGGLRPGRHYWAWAWRRLVCLGLFAVFWLYRALRKGRAFLPFRPAGIEDRHALSGARSVFRRQRRSSRVEFGIAASKADSPRKLARTVCQFGLVRRRPAGRRADGGRCRNV